MDTTSIQSKIKLSKKHLCKKEKNMEMEFNKIADGLEQILADKGAISTKCFYLTLPKIVNKWYHGKVSSIEVYEKLRKIESSDPKYINTAKNKVVKPMKNYLHSCVKQTNRNTVVENAVRSAIQSLELNLVDEYAKYMRLLRIYFKKACELEETQLKVFYSSVWSGRKQENPLNKTEMTLDQAVKFIKSQELNKFPIKSVKANGIIYFQKDYEDTGRRTEWFAVSESHKKFLKREFGIKIEEVMTDEEIKTFYEGLEQSINAGA